MYAVPPFSKLPLGDSHVGTFILNFTLLRTLVSSVNEHPSSFLVHYNSAHRTFTNRWNTKYLSVYCFIFDKMLVWNDRGFKFLTSHIFNCKHIFRVILISVLTENRI